jgi:hypothetical protein
VDAVPQNSQQKKSSHLKNLPKNSGSWIPPAGFSPVDYCALAEESGEAESTGARRRGGSVETRWSRGEEEEELSPVVGAAG